MSKLSRRSFVKVAAATGAAVAVADLSALSYGRVVGANERLRGAIAGAGGRGGEHLKFYADIFKAAPLVEIVAVVDADSQRAGKLGTGAADAFGNTPKTYSDYRKMLDDKSIDFVSVASCNHWHALMGIWACQAGKDVYVEKPCCHNVYEGRVLVEAAKKYGRLVQHGTQRRSESGSARLIAAVKSGKYGKLQAAKVYCRRPRGPLGFKPVTDPPATLGWNQWTGPAAFEPFTANHAPYNWHWFWNTGNGEIGNNGVHYFDLCRWATDIKHPSSAVSFGTRFVNDPDNKNRDEAETPTIQFVLYDFGGVPVIYESCNLAGAKDKWQPHEMAEFYTDEGVLSGGTFRPHSGDAAKIEVDFVAPVNDERLNKNDSSLQNVANFLNAIRGMQSLNAPIDEGFYSASVCHWGNASYRTAKPMPLAKCREALGTNAVMQKSIDVVLENLDNVLGSDRAATIPYVLGDVLTIDVEAEKLVGDTKANDFLKRPVRQPFAVPEVEQL
ncbi:MAG: Gfo/Idh/MocA family protein [Thermoguttaceae bacterium]